MKGFEQQKNNNEDVVGGWSLQQCEEYLSKYPRGPKSDRVRARKKHLVSSDTKPTSTESKTGPTSTKKKSKTSKGKNERTTNLTNVSTAVSSSDTGTQKDYDKKKDGEEFFLKVLLSIGALVIAFGLGYVIELIFGAGPTIKYIITACGMALWKEIWD